MLNCLAFMAAAQQSKRADRIPDGFWQLNGYPFVIVSTDKVTETPQFSDSLFYAIADGIRFKVGTTSILTSDVHFTDTYTNGLLPIIKKEGMRLEGTEKVPLRSL